MWVNRVTSNINHICSGTYEWVNVIRGGGIQSFHLITSTFNDTVKTIVDSFDAVANGQRPPATSFLILEVTEDPEATDMYSTETLYRGPGTWLTTASSAIEELETFLDTFVPPEPTVLN